MLASGFNGLPNIIIGSPAEDLLPRGPISKPSLGPLDLFLLVQLLLLLLQEERLLDLNLDLLDEGRLGVFLLRSMRIAASTMILRNNRYDTLPDRHRVFKVV